MTALAIAKMSQETYSSNPDPSGFLSKKRESEEAEDISPPSWVVPQIYISHIYTRPKFTFPTFTQNPDLHKPKFTQTQIYTRPKFTQTQIYTNPFLDIYFNKPKFTQPKFTQNPNLHNPNLRNPNLHKTQIYTTQIYTKIKKNTILLSKFTQNWTQIYTDPNLHYIKVKKN